MTHRPKVFLDLQHSIMDTVEDLSRPWFFAYSASSLQLMGMTLFVYSILYREETTPVINFCLNYAVSGSFTHFQYVFLCNLSTRAICKEL